MKNLVLLGSTGSIGTQTLDICEDCGYNVLALAAGRQVKPFEDQIRTFRPKYAVMFDEAAAKDLKTRVADLDVTVLSGMEGLCTLASLPQADLVLNSVVGMVGLQPTLAAVEAGHDVALANKETLVAGGALVMDAVKRKGVKLLPVDSEHSAIFQCLQGAPERPAVKRLILTASGGPFFGKTAQELETVTLQDALKHPNWSMGAKITVDSASMMNKGLELIEARWLFDTDPSCIDVIVHRESIIHSLVEYVDNAVVAQLGVPDMRVPIQYALTYPDRTPSPVGQLSLADVATMTFYKPDDETFRCLPICREAITKGGMTPAAVNGANEQAVALFMQGKIGFMDIPRMAQAALDARWPQSGDVQTVLETDRAARELVLSRV
ncbi:MAG: 1-deoxy-D-xylulose-5-phosphate reductoisomerase [Ruminococcaceae bacterium]|nr:1-deoxy-D-xylulose-5-phosphate reductoisomerase [Oscillospiraceae bacterium]